MVRNACRIHPSVLLAVTALGAEASPELVGDWLTGLAVGDGMQVGDPRLTLRNTYIQNYRSLNRSGGLRQSWYYVTRAWNAYVDGDELKLLRFMKRYEMPTIVGTV
jgi:hypothetical protein